ncbi:hypothetical protein TrVE_jg4482 [Triparma verrucosa]|uniref:Uncharacterized protein n=1 Tax=Triparma verrucosa TaxID=1606542 RepID=A0A9W6ZBZ2_9STRA|nr:hypothetical protein TrVE_jg4482 [Triparma verrucosa]
MKVPDSLQTFGNNVFLYCSKLVPSDIDVDKVPSVTSEVVAHLRAQLLPHLRFSLSALRLPLRQLLPHLWFSLSLLLFFPVAFKKKSAQTLVIQKNKQS